VSISPTFFEHLYYTKVMQTALLYLKFGFILFWRKKIGGKAVPKMLVKLTVESLFFIRTKLI
jgi:hypothetical protein